MTKQYSFPNNVNPLCRNCQELHEDFEEDNIKCWCDLPNTKDCSVSKTYEKRS